jgi:hypothetical protein
MALSGLCEVRADTHGTVSLLGAYKTLESDWKPVRDQGESGLAFSVGAEGWPVWIAIDYLSGLDEDHELTGLGIFAPLFGQPISETVAESKTRELDIGIRKIWGRRNVQPYLGGGLALVKGEIHIGNLALDDSTTGMWFNAGLMFALGEHFRLGLDLRVSRGEISLRSRDLEAGGEHLGVSAGWAW